MLSSKPKLSIIIIAYNEESYIHSCLKAIQQQTVPPDEVILVNNNSTDKTVDIAKQFPFVHILDEHEQGMIPARNAGLNAAKGDLLARIDADTIVPVHWCEKIHEACDPYAQKICGFSGPQYFYSIKNRKFRTMVSYIFSYYGFFGVSKVLLGHETLFGSNMIITKSAWEKVKGEVCHDSKKVHEDIDLAIHIGKYGPILFDKNLIVGVSARPLQEGLKKNIWRLTTWVKTITRHRPLFIGTSPYN